MKKSNSNDEVVESFESCLSALMPWSVVGKPPIFKDRIFKLKMNCEGLKLKYKPNRPIQYEVTPGFYEIIQSYVKKIVYLGEDISIDRQDGTDKNHFVQLEFVNQEKLFFYFDPRKKEKKKFFFIALEKKADEAYIYYPDQYVVSEPEFQGTKSFGSNSEYLSLVDRMNKKLNDQIVDLLQQDQKKLDFFIPGFNSDYSNRYLDELEESMKLVDCGRLGFISPHKPLIDYASANKNLQIMQVEFFKQHHELSKRLSHTKKIAVGLLWGVISPKNFTRVKAVTYLQQWGRICDLLVMVNHTALLSVSNLKKMGFSIIANLPSSKMKTISVILKRMSEGERIIYLLTQARKRHVSSVLDLTMSFDPYYDLSVVLERDPRWFNEIESINLSWCGIHQEDDIGSLKYKNDFIKILKQMPKLTSLIFSDNELVRVTESSFGKQIQAEMSLKIRFEIEKAMMENFSSEMKIISERQAWHLGFLKPPQRNSEVEKCEHVSPAKSGN